MKLTYHGISLALLLIVSLPAPASADTSLNIVASMGKFAPDAIQMHVGENTTLHVTSTEGVHYLKSEELGIPLTTIAPGSVVTVVVAARKTGTYVLHCAMFCGPGHEDMEITVTVVQ
jgi:heme/copper-type cytochrome/quinol oxidase subunit 2